MSNISTTSSGSFIPQIVRIKTVIQMTGLSRSAIYEKMNPKSPYFEAHFPRSIKLGAAAVGWSENEVKEWINMRMNSRQIQENCA